MNVSGISIDRVTITALPCGLDTLVEQQLSERFKLYVSSGRLLHAITLDDSSDAFEQQTLSFLLRLSCIVSDAGGAICLITARPRTRSILGATRMDRIFAVFENIDEAVASLAPFARRLSA